MGWNNPPLPWHLRWRPTSRSSGPWHEWPWVQHQPSNHRPFVAKIWVGEKWAIPFLMLKHPKFWDSKKWRTFEKPEPWGHWTGVNIQTDPQGTPSLATIFPMVVKTLVYPALLGVPKVRGWFLTNSIPKWNIQKIHLNNNHHFLGTTKFQQKWVQRTIFWVEPNFKSQYFKPPTDAFCWSSPPRASCCPPASGWAPDPPGCRWGRPGRRRSGRSRRFPRRTSVCPESSPWNNWKHGKKR